VYNHTCGGGSASHIEHNSTTRSEMAQAHKQKLMEVLKPKLEAFHAASSANNAEEIRQLFSDFAGKELSSQTLMQVSFPPRHCLGNIYIYIYIYIYIITSTVLRVYTSCKTTCLTEAG